MQFRSVYMWGGGYKWYDAGIVRRPAFSLNNISWTLSVSARVELTCYFNLLQGVPQCGPWEDCFPISCFLLSTFGAMARLQFPSLLKSGVPVQFPSGKDI